MADPVRADAVADTKETPQATDSRVENEKSAPDEEVLERVWRKLDAFSYQRGQDPDLRRRNQRAIRIYALVATMFALAGTIAGLLTWYKPLVSPFFVPMFITEYQSRLMPVNSQADPDREALRIGNYFPRSDENAFASQERHLLLQELTALKARAPSDSLVIYLCAFAGAAKQGEVLLFPADVKPDDPSSLLPLRDVLLAMAESPARHKLLVLDIMRPMARRRFDILIDDVPSNVKAEVEEQIAALRQEGKDPRRLGLVLCACSPGQVSLNSEDLKRSVFGYYFEEALRGWADGYAPGLERDSRISVKDLAGFVHARVDRWAQSNRKTRQTPMLLGVGADFKLVSLAHGNGEPPPEVPELGDYPAWLTSGWKLRDLWRKEERYRDDPRIYEQLVATLLRAEQQWRGGVGSQRIASELQERMQHFQFLYEQVRKRIPRPQPVSIALALAQGRQPDPALGIAFKDLLTAIAQQSRELKPDEAKKANDKLVQAFLDKFKACADFDLAWAAFEQVLNDPEPKPDSIRTIDELLARRQPQPRYVETLFLRRLANLANSMPADAWPTRVVRRSIELVGKGERAASDARVFPWISGLLRSAAQKRYDGEVLLFAREFAPLELADQLLRSASDDYDVILGLEDTLRRGQSRRDIVLTSLRGYATFVLFNPALEKTWQETAKCVQELDSLLVVPTGKGISAAEIQRKVELIGQKSEDLGNHFFDLTWSFTAQRQASLIQQSGQPNASPTILADLESLLETPFPNAEDRVALWKASRALSRRFLDKCLDLDAQENELRHLTAPLAPFEVDRDRYLQRQHEQALLSIRTRFTLMDVGGLPLAKREKLRKQFDALRSSKISGSESAVAGGNASLRDLGEASRLAFKEWRDELREHYDPVSMERLCFVIPPFENAPRIDDPTTNPTVELRSREARLLWTWLVDLYHYESRDLDGSSFYSAAAIEYQRRANSPNEVTLEISGLKDVSQLNRNHPSGGGTLDLTLFTTAASPAKVELKIVTADDEWLAVHPPQANLLDPLRLPGKSLRTCSVPILVELKPGAELSRKPRPRGFLVLITVDDRTYHYKVAIPSLPRSSSDSLEVLLSTDPSEPTSTTNDLRLRPVRERQPYFLYVRNSTSKARNVIVQLRGPKVMLQGGEAKLSVAANTILPVFFVAPPAPAPATPPATPPAATPAPSAAPVVLGALPEFAGPLNIRLLNGDKPEEILDEKNVRVQISSPLEYLQVTEVRFSPSTGKPDSKNRLVVKVKLRQPLAGPPCLVQLVLPPERIPGFISAKDGNFSGTVPNDGSELVLYANDIRLEPAVKLEGSVYLTVDGLERAFIFNTTFARNGAPTSPREDDRPALRLNALRFAPSNSKYMVRIEVDNPPASATLETTLGDGTFENDLVKKLAQARRQHIGLALGGTQASLFFEAAIQDWSFPLDASGIRGERVLRTILKDKQGNEIDMVEQPVTFDDSAPANVQFVNAPSQARKDLPLPLQASGGDAESGIAKVLFFMGKPVDGKIPATSPPVAALPLDDDKSVWAARLPLQGLVKGPTEFSVQFVNGVGLTSFQTITIDLLDADAAKGPGRIKGKVTEGTRPQIGLEVTLSEVKPNDKPATPTDDKGKKTVKSGKDGTYVFEDVAPGKYKVTSTKISTDRKATADVIVEPGQTVEVPLALFR